MKSKLVFDTTSAGTILDSDNVGAYLRASDGTLLTHTTSGAKEALDVNMVNEIAVALNGIYDVSTNPTPDNVGMIVHVRDATVVAADQTFRSTGGDATADAVVAANVHGLDTMAFNMAFNGTTWDRLRSTSGSLNVSDAGGSLTVDQTAAASSVSAWTKDGAGTSITSTTGALDVNIKSQTGTLTVSDAALAVTAVVSGATTAGTSAAALVGSALAARKYLFAYNNGNRRVYVGTTGVTTSNGYPIDPGSELHLRAGAAVAVQVIGAAASQDVRTLELS